MACVRCGPRNYHSDIKIVEPSFPGGKIALEQFVRLNRDSSIVIPDSLNSFNDSFYNEFVSFEVNTNGNIYDSVLEEWAGFKYCIEDIKNLLSKMPNWIPAYRFNERTKKKIPILMPGGFSIKYYYKSKK